MKTNVFALCEPSSDPKILKILKYKKTNKNTGTKIKETQIKTNQNKEKRKQRTTNKNKEKHREQRTTNKSKSKQIKNTEKPRNTQKNK